MSIYQKVNQTKMVTKLFWINFPEGCLSLINPSLQVDEDAGAIRRFNQSKKIGLEQNWVKDLIGRELND